MALVLKAQKFNTLEEARDALRAVDERMHPRVSVDGDAAVDVQDGTGKFLAASSGLKISIIKDGAVAVEKDNDLGADVVLPFNDATDKATDVTALCTALNKLDWDPDDSGENAIEFVDAGYDTDKKATGILRVKHRVGGGADVNENKFTIVDADTDATYNVTDGGDTVVAGKADLGVASKWDRTNARIKPVRNESQGLPDWLATWWEPV